VDGLGLIITSQLRLRDLCALIMCVKWLHHLLPIAVERFISSIQWNYFWNSFIKPQAQ